ncbi:MAG: nucleoside kinase [Tenericutes bacterium]|nr:nucleoside kinase [Mycoplasmatota bacterium]
MIESIEVTINNQKYRVSSGVTLEEVAAQFQKEYKYPILLAKVNGITKELSCKVQASSNIEFLDLTSKEGNRTHISGLTYILLYAVKRLYGKDANIYVQHSLDKGIYVETSFKLTPSKIENIKAEMDRIVENDLPIIRTTIDRLEAINYFKTVGNEVKAEVLRYNTNTYVTLYRLGNYYNYFYNLMPTSTSKISAFDLTYIKDNAFVMRFPTIYQPNKIKEYEEHPGMFSAFQEFRDWGKIMKITTSVDLNKIVSSGKINDLIRIDETLQSNRLLNLAKTIHQNKKIKIVLMAGPSSSGKTTTSRKLCMYLQSFGLTPKVLSMDDYFHERKDTPKDANGNYDFECLEAVDLKLFNSQLADLLKGEKVQVPTFNFGLGKKEYRHELQLAKDDIIVIEGIHALNPKILTNIPRENKFKIYICPLTEINMDDHNRVSTTDNRLLRRIIRDNRTRNYSVEKTLAAWSKVRAGEEKYIFPYQDEADFTMNSALIYEIGALKTYVEPLLYSVPYDSPYYEESKRLLNFLRIFLPIPADEIPKDSVLREFIGNGCFHD